MRLLVIKKHFRGNLSSTSRYVPVLQKVFFRSVAKLGKLHWVLRMVLQWEGLALNWQYLPQCVDKSMWSKNFSRLRIATSTFLEGKVQKTEKSCKEKPKKRKIFLHNWYKTNYCFELKGELNHLKGSKYKNLINKFNELNKILLINLCKIKQPAADSKESPWKAAQRLNSIFRTGAVLANVITQNSFPLRVLLVWISKINKQLSCSWAQSQSYTNLDRQCTAGWPGHASTERIGICISSWQHPHSSHFPITCRKLHNTSNRSGDGHTLLHRTVKEDSIEECNL